MVRGTESLPPEIALIREKRSLAVPRMSHKRAAELAEQHGGGSFSSSTWGKIEKGDYTPPADRLVIMALVVGVTATELDEAGRPDVARLLREEIRRRAQADPAMAEVDPASTPEAILQMVVHGLEEIRALPGLTDEQKKGLEESLIRNVRQNIATQIDQIRTVLDQSHGGSTEKFRS